MLAGVAVAICAACGAVRPSVPSMSHARAPSAPSPSAARASSRPRAARGRARHARERRSSASLVYSPASNEVVQRQPAPGSCHAIGSGLYERPAPSCTPGALNPAVTQATIQSTICVSGWTESVRPPENITEEEKVDSLAAYGDTGPLSSYEYDHFVPLELGGATNDPRNLWPEPGASPNPKDAVEDALRAEVCHGQLTLARAQREIALNWTALSRRSSSMSRHSAAQPSAAVGRCSMRAAYNSRYHDYDVYVHSNQPDRTVTVSDGLGDSATWHTDSTGFADVFLRATGSASGARVTVSVGRATCSGTL